MDNSQRVNELVAELNRDKLAWAWDDELPDNYDGPKYYWPEWLRTHDGRRPVILRGSREWRDSTQASRQHAAHEFILRAARMLRITSDDPYEHPAIEAIKNHCQLRWPSGNAWRKILYSHVTRWEHGELILREERVLERKSLNELYAKESVVRNIAQMVRELRRHNAS